MWTPLVENYRRQGEEDVLRGPLMLLFDFVRL
jgi:hypothetical protein